MRRSTSSKPIIFAPLVTQDHARSSLAKVPSDILVIIAELVQSTSPASLSSLGLVARSFYCLIRDVRFRHLHLTLPATAREVQVTVAGFARVEAEGLLPTVRVLTVRDATTDAQQKHESYQACLSTVCRLISKMPKLKKLAYHECCAPAAVLSVLECRPSITLHTNVHSAGRMSGRQPYRTDGLVRLQSIANLRVLEIRITYFTAEDCLELMRPLKRMLLTSRNLRSLSLDVVQPSGDVHGSTQLYRGLGFIAGEQLPVLDELTLINYPFGHAPRSGFHHDFNCLGYPTTGTEIDFWAAEFDWSRLKRLKTPYAELPRALLPRLVLLEDFDSSWSNADTSYFCTGVPSALRSISTAQVTLTSLLRHSRSLEVLQLHQGEAVAKGGSWNDQALDVASLRHIQSECHSITDLCIDLARDGDWPYECFEVLASFSNLRRLEVYFELGVNSPDEPIEPYLTFSTSAHIFEYLRSKSSKSGARLEHLVLRSGSSPTAVSGFPTPKAFWPTYNSTAFVCNLAERDDEASAGIYSVSSPSTGIEERYRRGESFSKTADAPGRMKLGNPVWTKLRRRILTQLSRSSRTGDPLTKDDTRARDPGHAEAVLVACNGPKRRSQWAAHY